MLSAIFSMLLYLISILLITPLLMKSGSNNVTPAIGRNKMPFFLTALCALGLHYAHIQSQWGYAANGADSPILEVSSLISLVIALLVSLAMLFRVKTLAFLLAPVYGFALINLVLSAFIPSQVVHLSHNLFIHISLSLLTYSVCFIAMLYSIQLAWLDHNLKHKKILPNAGVPPLMLVERHFFRVMLSGEALLTIILITGSYHLAGALEAENIYKGLFSLLSWLTFGTFLFGYWKWHWRGKRMIIFTISGMILLTVAYFGSKLI